MSVLTVDLDAFSANLRTIAARVAPATHMLVVKDDAYAHGLVPIVRRAWRDGVRWFGAFDVSTGRAVREELGPDARIFVWVIGTPEEAASAVAARLDVGIGDATLLEDVAGAATDASATARVHLKIDSGLHRNGVRPEEWPAFVARARELEQAGSIEVVGVWSHIAEASDDDDDAARTVFDAACDAAHAAGLRPAQRHLAASAAAFARPEFRCDLVRVGAFAYGIRPADGPTDADLGIRPIGRLETGVVAVGDGTATIGIGSLDGLPSPLAGLVMVSTPQGRRPLVDVGLYASTIGEWGAARVGDLVTVYGDADSGAMSATDLAETIGTIGEEIALRISPLVPRNYR
ncbi:alanine racemase [Microbacterium sp. P5_E9]